MWNSQSWLLTKKRSFPLKIKHQTSSYRISSKKDIRIFFSEFKFLLYSLLSNISSKEVRSSTEEERFLLTTVYYNSLSLGNSYKFRLSYFIIYYFIQINTFLNIKSNQVMFRVWVKLSHMNIIIVHHHQQHFSVIFFYSIFNKIIVCMALEYDLGIFAV